MRSLTVFTLCLALGVSAFAKTEDYEVFEVDAKGGTISGRLGTESKTFKVRTGADVTINGEKAGFAEVEPGMSVRVTTSEPGVASRLVASGVRTRPHAGQTQRIGGTSTAPSKMYTATIPSNSPTGFSLGDVQKGTLISFQYVDGKWKNAKKGGPVNPDEDQVDETMRVAIALPGENDEMGKTVGLVAAGTTVNPFVFEAQDDYKGLLLRMNEKAGGPKPKPKGKGKDAKEPKEVNPFSDNSGKVDYTVKVLPPIR